MSSEVVSTRTAILEAAWKRLIEHGPSAMKLGPVARDAGVSRQAIYLHFKSRADVLLGLVAYADQTLGLGQLLEQAVTEDPVDYVCNVLAVTARFAPAIQEVALAFQLNRHLDPDIAAAFEDRMQHRRANLRRAVQAAAEAGRLVDGVNVEEVVDAMWALGMPTFYQSLVIDRGWEVEQYARFLGDTFRRLYVRPSEA